MRDNVDHWRAPLERQIDRLVGTGCLIETHDRSTVTAFGLAVARSGLKPETASYFIQRLVQHCESSFHALPTPGIDTAFPPSAGLRCSKRPVALRCKHRGALLITSCRYESQSQRDEEAWASR